MNQAPERRAIKALKHLQIRKGDDNHHLADIALCALLIDIGYKAVVDQYKKVNLKPGKTSGTMDNSKGKL